MPIDEIQDFQDWVVKFEKSKHARIALELLENAFPAAKESELVGRFYPLRDSVLHSCYGAAMFRLTGEPAEDRIHDDRAAMRILKGPANALDAITTLRALASEQHRVLQMAFFGVLLDLKAEGIEIRRTDDRDRDPLVILEHILAALQARLSKPIPFVGSGPLLDRFTYGCFIYDTALDGVKNTSRPESRTMLLFDLVQQFRLRSQGIPTRQIGETMPKLGDPHYDVAAAFVNATFDGDPASDGSEVDDRLKRFREGKHSLGYYPWPVFRD